MKSLNKVINIFYIIGVAAIYSSWVAADVAVDALNANHLDEARQLFLQQLPKDDTKNSVLIHLGEVEFHAGNYDKSIDYLQQALSANPNSAESYLLLGRAYGRKAQASSLFSAIGLAKECLGSFEKAYTLDAKDTDVVKELVEYHANAPAIVGGSHEKYLQYLAELKQLSPPMALIYEINQFEKDKLHAHAMKLAYELQQQNNLPIAVQYLLSRFYMDNKAYPEAEEVQEKLITTPLTTQTNIEERWYIADAFLQMGEVFLATHKQLDRAVVLVQHFKDNTKDPRDIHYLWAFWSLAKIYKANGDLDKYQSEVSRIKTLDYKKNKAFARQFEVELKS